MDDLTVERFMPPPSLRRNSCPLSTGLEFEERRRILVGKEIPADGQPNPVVPVDNSVRETWRETLEPAEVST